MEPPQPPSEPRPDRPASANPPDAGALLPAEQKGRGFRISEFSIRYPVTISMALALLLVLGAISVFKIPLVLAPDISFPFVMVNVPYSNSTPEQVMETITKPLEEALTTIPHVKQNHSRSGENESRIFLNFDWGQDVDWLRSQVREVVEQVRGELPPDIRRIIVANWGTDDEPILGARIASSRDLRKAYDFLDLKIKKPLERLPGVADVEIWGAQRREIDIYLRLDDVKRYRLDAAGLFRQLDAANLNNSLGWIEDGGTRFTAVRQGELRSLEEIRDLPVNATGLRLRDIADIDFDSPARNSGRHLNGVPSVSFWIRKTAQANTVEVVDRVLARIEEMNQDPSLEGLQILIQWNAAREIRRGLFGLLEAGIVGGALAFVVLILFLRRVGATLFISVAIPFSVVAAVGFIYLLGNTLNVLSMMGLMLATGMLVDNAVVVLESIYQKLEKGYDRITAAKTGTQDVIAAVVAATLTSIIIFVPLVFGKKTNYSVFLGHTGVAIMLALMCSLFVSITLIPMGVARILDFRPQRGWFERFIDRLAARMPWRNHPLGRKGGLTDAYLRLVDWPLRHRFLVGLLLAPALIASSLLLMKYKVPDNSPEASDLDDIRINYEFTENYHYAKIERDFVTPIEQFLLARKDEYHIQNIESMFENNWAYTQVKFDKETMTLEQLQEIRKLIARELPEIPGANIRVGGQEGGGGRNWLGVNLYGEDPATLQELSVEARRRLKEKPGFDEVDTAADRGYEEVQIRLDRDRAAKHGISPQVLAAVLEVTVRGRRVRSFHSPEGEVEIWVKLQPDDRQNLEDLKSIAVSRGPGGQEVLLSHVADISLTKTPAQINRENRRTYAGMWALYTGEKKEEGNKLLTEVMNSLPYPPGYSWSFGFFTQRREQEDREFLFNLLLAIFMVYFVMAAQFESIAHPFAIMISLPFALVGVAWFLYLTSTPFNLMAMIGMIILVGIVVNNGIVLIDHINNLRRRGLPRAEAVRMACRERLRPIVMTATTTIVGMIPLAVGQSGLFDLRYFPMARTIMGGLAASTVLTLLVLPAYYTLFDDLAAWVKRTWRASDPARQAAPASAPAGD